MDQFHQWEGHKAQIIQFKPRYRMNGWLIARLIFASIGVAIGAFIAYPFTRSSWVSHTAIMVAVNVMVCIALMLFHVLADYVVWRRKQRR